MLFGNILLCNASAVPLPQLQFYIAQTYLQFLLHDHLSCRKKLHHRGRVGLGRVMASSGGSLASGYIFTDNKNLLHLQMAQRLNFRQACWSLSFSLTWIFFFRLGLRRRMSRPMRSPGHQIPQIKSRSLSDSLNWTVWFLQLKFTFGKFPLGRPLYL